MTDQRPSFDAGLRRLLDAIGDAVIWGGADGSVYDCNAAACALFGHSRKRMLELTREELLVVDAPVVAGIREREEKGAARGRTGIRREGGDIVPCEVTALALPGAPHQVWVVLRALVGSPAEEFEGTEIARALSDATFEAVLIHRDGVIRTANRTAEILAGVAPGALTGRMLMDFIAPADRAMMLARIASRDEAPIEAMALRADGSAFPVEAQARTLPVYIGGSALRVAVIRDLTSRRALEDQLRQAQKMEAVGRLAGGIAHDFNNLLSVIIGAAELAIEQLPPGHPVRGELSEVVAAGDRASALTRQLLAFSRKQVLREQILDLNEVLGGMHSMIRRLIGEDVHLQLQTSPTPAPLRADVAQLEQVVMNLVVNARDAMPRGGRLTLASAVIDLDPDRARRLELAPGRHVALRITDTGVGMDAATRSRLFEPFFTTKGPGEGTGLGLSTVFGIVKQSRGALEVESEVGAGSTFTVLFPWSDEPLAAEASGRPGPAPAARPRCILVVEDEPQLRRVIVRVLRRAGYEVHEARGPGEALEFAQRYAGPIDLLLSDIVMPQVNGRELGARFAVLRPDATILLMSGYTDIPVGNRGDHFLPKPIVPDTLLSKVRSLIG